ncbi:MAG TPA: ATP-binding protein [Solirubrobacteraceae bacterium]|nr:ATP-binding protein [Solirubrobacteraceae bacterium]
MAADDPPTSAVGAPASARERLRLAPEQLRRRCDPAALGFRTTAEVEAADGAAGQQRALRALDFAVEVSQLGYNVFATGPAGTGRRETIETRLRERARTQPAPHDVVFLFNFEDPGRPLCVTLAPGQGRRLAATMAAFVAQAAREIPNAFESESYRRRRAEVTEPFEHEREQLLEQVRSFARARGLELEVTPAGVVSIPLVHGQPVTPREFQQLPEETRRQLSAAGREVEERMNSVVPALRELESRTRERVRALDREVVLFAVGHLIDEVKQQHADAPTLSSWLEHAREDVVDNYGGFLADAEQTQLAPPMQAMLGRGIEAFHARYEVNPFVVSEQNGAPVVLERNPTFPRLFGRIEFETTLGAAITDHRHIKPGSIHTASGGYMILRAEDVLRQPFVWERLKEILRTGQARVENLGEQFMLFPTATLTPDPVPVAVKLVLTGSVELYELMHALDEDVAELFRVRADFDVQMPWDEQEPARYAAVVSSLVARDGLLHFDAAAVARVVEDGARRAAHQGKLSMRYEETANLVTEASHWAAHAGAALVGAEHVEQAIRERRARSDLLEQRLAEMIDEGTVHIQLTGGAVGQLNGLAVLALGDYAFGHPARITATTAIGGGEVVSIDRESKLTGKIHDKGFLTLRGYLEQHYGGQLPLALSASLTFEQSYGGLEGDSASSAELYALLSSLADAPIHQGIAVTGSVDQHGRIQAVGGVTEKVEGFFAACERAGLTGEQGVIVPASNRRHLMLEERVVAAVREGRFHVWAVHSVDEGIELLTGLPAGERQADGSYPEGSLHRRVHDRLGEMARAAREWGRAGGEEHARGRAGEEE